MLDMPQDLIALLRVRLNECELVPRQPAGFGENHVRDPDLSDVVQHRAPEQVLEIAPRQAQCAPDVDRDPLHALGVARGVRVLGLYGFDQHARELVSELAHGLECILVPQSHTDVVGDHLRQIAVAGQEVERSGTSDENEHALNLLAIEDGAGQELVGHMGHQVASRRLIPVVQDQRLLAR